MHLNQQQKSLLSGNILINLDKNYFIKIKLQFKYSKYALIIFNLLKQINNQKKFFII